MSKRSRDACQGKWISQDGAFLGDTIECGVCACRMLGHIISCKEGHCVCQGCYEKLLRPKRCPQCRVPFSRCRNRALEAVVEKCSFACEHGCGLMAKPAELLEHQSLCEKAPVPCPEIDCSAQMPPSKLIRHIQDEHGDEAIWWTTKQGKKFVSSSMGLEVGPDHWYEIFGFDSCDGQGKDGAFMYAARVEGHKSVHLWHIRVFHFAQERAYEMTLGRVDGCQISFTDKTESIRGYASMKSANGNEERGFDKGFVILEPKLKTLATDIHHDPIRVDVKIMFS